MTTTASAGARVEGWNVVLVAAPLLVSAALGLHIRARNGDSLRSTRPALQPIATASAVRLATLFDAIDYAWPPTQRVPAIAVEHFPADMAALPVDTKKKVFLKTVLPLVLAENAHIRKQRQFILAQFAAGHTRAGTAGYDRLQRLAAHYRIDKPLDDPQVRAGLLRRVDTLPPPLVLAQAAKESGWGTSYFAREANNLFGMWTWNADAGIAPRGLNGDAEHYVRVFGTLRDSVRAYLYTINVGRAYKKLRAIRAEMRAAAGTPRALKLAGTLENYSAHGKRYNAAVRAIIAQNGLDGLGELGLRSVGESLIAVADGADASGGVTGGE